MERAPIKILDPQTTAYRVVSHVELEVLISQLKGKHAKAVANELRIMYTRYLQNGYFSFNSKVFRYIHGDWAYRELLLKTIKSCSVVCRNHRGGHNSKYRQFTFGGVQKQHTYNGDGGSCLNQGTKGSCNSRSKLFLPESLQRWHSISGSWMMDRYEQWCQFCRENDLPQNVDFDGTTEWGAAALDAVVSCVVPTETSHDSNPEAGQRQLDRLTKSGVLNVAFRRHGRAFSALTGLNRSDRANVTLDSEGISEADVHACYIALLLPFLPRHAREAVKQKLQEGSWYDQFQDTYDAFAIHKRRQMQRRGASQDEIDARLVGVKIEFQRQCLFGYYSLETYPMWHDLRRNHPELAFLVRNMNRYYGGSEFAIRMMKREGALFVDRVIPHLHREGIRVIGVHDGLAVKHSDAQRTREILEMHAEQTLGFVPGVKIKGNPAPEQVAA